MILTISNKTCLIKPVYIITYFGTCAETSNFGGAIYKQPPDFE